MYIDVNVVNTKACINATAISNIVIKTTTKNGNTLTIEIIPPAVNIVHVNPLKIANNKCPAVMFALNRKPRLIAFTICDTNSIGINNGANAIGDPLSIKFDM